MRRYRSVLLIVLLGIVPVIALVISVWLYFGERPAEPPAEQVVEAQPPPPAEPPPPPVDVWAADRNLEVGALLTATDIVAVPIEAAAVRSDHLRRDQTSLSELVGSVVRKQLLAGQPLTWTQLVRSGQDGFLAAALAPNRRAVTITVNQETSHAGLISPGDRVDVIFTMQTDRANPLSAVSRTVLENIRVVAVNRRVEPVAGEAQPQDGEGGRRDASQTVTLEVLPLEADRLVLATSQGSLSLALRPLSRSGRSGRRPQSGVAMLLPSEQEEPVRVQVYRGTSREEVLLAE